VSGGLILATPASCSGKTVLSLGLLGRLARTGHSVASAKAGPDYIDSSFHAAASGAPCLNLDAWAMRLDMAKKQDRPGSSPRLAALGRAMQLTGKMHLDLDLVRQRKRAEADAERRMLESSRKPR